MAKRFTQDQVNQIARSMLYVTICRYGNGGVTGVDRIRKAFNKMAMSWVYREKQEKKAEKT